MIDINNITEKAGRTPFFVKMLGISFMLIVIFCIGGLIETRVLLYNALKKQFDEKGIALCKGLAERLAEPIITGDLSNLFNLLKETRKNHSEIRYVLALDGNYKIIVHTFEHNASNELIKAHTVNLHNPPDFHLETFDTEEGEILDVLVPVMEGRLGVVRIGLEVTPVRNAMQNALEHLLVTAIILSAIGILISYLLTYILNKPLSKLITTMGEISKGNFATRIHITTDDEFGRLGNKFNRMAEVLEKNQIELKQKEMMRQELIKKIIFAQEEERSRIARELHDEIGQTLATLKVALKSLDADNLSEGVKNKLDGFRTLLNTSLENIHDLAVELRPPLLGDFGLREELKNFADEFEKAFDINVKCNISGFPENYLLPYPLRIGLYRVMQEAFSNIEKHAKATRVNVIFQKKESQLIFAIEDNGIGFNPEFPKSSSQRKPIGLFGMDERVEILGGKLNIESKIGQGTRIYITVPIKDSL